MSGIQSCAIRVEPNVTPMIDVMLVLLIIFMIVGPTLDHGFTATPPESQHAARHPDDAGEAVIGLDAQGRLYLDKIPVDTATLRRALGNRFRARPEDRVVFLRADVSLPFGQLQETMELASSAGARVVGLVSSTIEKGSRGERR